LFGGWGVIIYITLWFIMPKEPLAWLEENSIHADQGFLGEREKGQGSRGG